MKTIKIYGNPFKKPSFYYNCKDIFCRRYRKKINFKTYIPNILQCVPINDITKIQGYLNKKSITKRDSGNEKSFAGFINEDKVDLNNFGVVETENAHGYRINKDNIHPLDMELTAIQNESVNFKRTEIHVKINLNK
jgi:hypothetical protein